ncbi:MAG: hypothetical protein GWM93_05025 [Gemmatimonadetes bacterium]|uniref:Uncharacterized protein n=1 Tax=Candidatus Kutchimonas denitrificans TaxID=3056748 RepID=A0AAE5CCK9_9BACT|nr:hypothetical protein [Gemmatimonadota bacterium]NIR75780.1 hypothetical protein [Candidatus Kutchimonas denitrificans]NIT66043.1 hypothetical protein [Gemmatimonadota bacterium]NIY34621.1 hypothetical protein [Gemmatimonadota bacterium]NIY42858.1 hypothetical protein [Gemmatimonadota bacterium]
MKIPTLLLVSVGSFLLLQLALVPLAKSRWKADKTAASVSKAGVLAGFSFLASVALAASIATGLAIVAVSLFRLVPTEYRWILDSIASLQSSVGGIGSTTSVIIFVFLCAALLYLASRIGKRRMETIYRESLDRELERLQREAAEGKWKELESNHKMKEIERELQRVATLKAAFPRQMEHDPNVARNLAEFDKYEKMLRDQWMALDVQRRMRPSWTVEDFDGDKASLWRKFLAILFSKGTFDSASDLARAVGRVGMVLLFLSLIGLNGPMVIGQAEERSVQLTDLEIKAQKEAAIASGLKARAGEQASEIDYADEDQALADVLGRAFEEAFAASQQFFALTDTSDLNRRLHVFRVRNAVLAESTRPGRTAGARLEQHPSLAQSRSLTTAETEALDAFERGLDRLRPQTEVGRAVARDVRSSGIQGTSAWARLRNEFRARGAAFRQPLTIHDVGAEMFNRVVGAVIGDVGPDMSTEVGRLAIKLERQVGKGAIIRAYGIMRDQFLADIARGVDVERAVMRVMETDPALRVATNAQMRAARRLTAEIPRARAIYYQVLDEPPRLQWTDPGQLDASLARAERLGGNVVRPNPARLADNFAEYGSFFPANVEAVRTDTRVRAANRLAARRRASRPTGGTPSTRPIASIPVRSTSVSRAMVRRATSFGALRGFARVGGVLIGQDPQPGPDLGMTAIGWEEHGSDIELWLEGGGKIISLGRFDQGVAHQALAYAADDRRVAATMVSAPLPLIGGGPLKVLLHPALVDTRLGQDIVEIDRFVDTWRSWERRSVPPVARVYEALDLVQAHQDLYIFAWLVRLSASGLEPDTTHPSFDWVSDRVSDPDWTIRAALALEAPESITDLDISALSAKPEFYDRSLVEQISQCAPEAHGDLAAFRNCLELRWGTSGSPSWRWPPPHGQVWSGVRETPFQVDAELAFAGRGEAVRPLRFMLQLTFATPPDFVGLADEEREFYTDSLPWEFPAIATELDRSVARWAVTDPERRDVYENVVEFTYLQRLFRAAFDGRLGPGFALERLVDLARETRDGVRLAPTPRWSYPLELEIAGTIREFMDSSPSGQMQSLRASARSALSGCRALIESTPDVAAIEVEEWDSACDFSSYEEDAERICTEALEAEQVLNECTMYLLVQLSRTRQMRRLMY